MVERPREPRASFSLREFPGAATVQDVDVIRWKAVCTRSQHPLRPGNASSSQSWTEPLPVFVVLPTLEPHLLNGLLSAIQAELHLRTGVEILLEHHSLTGSSRAGMFTALRWAAEVLAEGRVPRVALLAADSLVAPETIREFERAGLLLSSANRDGRILGEAAAALIVEHPQRPRTNSGLASLLSIEEAHGPDSFEHLRAGRELEVATSLSQVFASTARLFSQRVDLVVSAQPSESHWAREFSYAYLRNIGLMPEPLRFMQTGAELGDTGAAAGAVALVRALREFDSSSWRAKPSSVLAFASSERYPLERVDRRATCQCR